MEANEAPEKIYFSGQQQWSNPFIGLVQCADTDIEYTRTDAFIEKTCQFIKENHHKYSSWNTEEYELEFNTEAFIEDFKNYMKGE